jgi:hypothetical protein
MAIPASSQTPAGTAGGDLSGSYPNPLVAAGGVAIADLAGYPNDGAKYARGDNTWSVIAATQAGTGGGLPATPGSGAPGRIRGGNSPFDFLTLYYDATLGRYVSAPFVMCQLSGAVPTSTSAVYSSLTGAEQTAPLLPYKTFVDAGLSLSLRNVAIFRNSSGANTTFSACIVQGYSVNAGLVNISNDAILEVSAATGTDVLKDSGWTDLVPVSSQDYMRTLVRVKVSAGTGTWTDVAVLGRWYVAA